MNGAVLLLPVLLVRYGFIPLLGRETAKRAAFWPPLAGRQRIAYWVYQVSFLLFCICLFFLQVTSGSGIFYAGLAVYGAGVLLLVKSAWDFSRTGAGGICRSGLYRFSRNPMYLSYFLCFSGCALLTRSVLLGCLLLAFQTASHFVILAEERWCGERFGKAYLEYCGRVRRYL